MYFEDVISKYNLDGFKKGGLFKIFRPENCLHFSIDHDTSGTILAVDPIK